MGACGCGDFQAQHRLPGPAGIVYAIQLYDSCEYCDTPAGVIVYRMDEKSAKEWHADSLPELPINTYSDSDDVNGQGVVIVMHPGSLADLVESRLDVPPGELEEIGAGGVADTIRESFREAVHASHRMTAVPSFQKLTRWTMTTDQFYEEAQEIAEELRKVIQVRGCIYERKHAPADQAALIAAFGRKCARDAYRDMAGMAFAAATLEHASDGESRAWATMFRHAERLRERAKELAP